MELSHKLWRITLVEGSNPQVPVVTSHQLLHTSLSTLKLCLSNWAWTEPDTILKSMTLLQKLLGFRVLKHVEVSSTQPIERLGGVNNPKEFQFAIQTALSQIENELKGNPYLQYLSMCVGWWQLLRVGTGAVPCETRYSGPCLRSEIQQEGEYYLLCKTWCILGWSL